MWVIRTETTLNFTCQQKNHTIENIQYRWVKFSFQKPITKENYIKSHIYILNIDIHLNAFESITPVK